MPNVKKTKFIHYYQTVTLQARYPMSCVTHAKHISFL